MKKGNRPIDIAFIPVRGGSKSIPLKNIKLLCGKPLVYWTVKAACECNRIDQVYVSTDSNEIRMTVENFGFEKVIVINRSAESAMDTASTESAMLEFAERYEFENIVLIQATSPLLTASDLDRGFALYDQPDCDSVFSAVHRYQFLWTNSPKRTVQPLNYDIFHRPRRQEYDGYFIENGAFYITSKKSLLLSKNRISGNIRALEMGDDSLYEIDHPSDWGIVEALMDRRNAARDQWLSNR